MGQTIGFKYKSLHPPLNPSPPPLQVYHCRTCLVLLAPDQQHHKASSGVNRDGNEVWVMPTLYSFCLK